jgi:hypothetical protein
VVAFTWEVVLFKSDDCQQVADVLGEVGVCDPYCRFGCLRIHASLQTTAQQQSPQQLQKARQACCNTTKLLQKLPLQLVALDVLFAVLLCWAG